MKRILAILLAACLAAPLFATGEKEAPAADASSTTIKTQADAAAYLKGKNIRSVIGSTAVTGDTYLTADLFARFVSEKYGCNMKTDPIGAGRALQEVVSTRPDGSTIMMFHDMTYLGVLFGAYEAEDYKLEKMIVGGTYAYSTADCFAASANAPYKTLAEMGKWMKDNPNEIVKFAVEAGGVSQLCFNVVYEWVNQTYGKAVASRIKVFVTGSTDAKLQALWDNNCQVVYAVATALQQYTKPGVDSRLKLNVIGISSGERYENEPWPTFQEQGITLEGKPFIFSKEYYVFYPIGIPADFIAAMDIAIADICKSPAYMEAVKKIGFVPQAKGSRETKTHIYAKRDSLVDLIAKAPDFDTLTK
ncbi:MAG: hypothetical protein LBK44_02055 [Spirochaetales bacterium]|jgi:tripartite-type tricarboxylate transporter receptor subunit TctC|nr:hypothetical protein [Spirochaetales bacterium]